MSILPVIFMIASVALCPVVRGDSDVFHPHIPHNHEPLLEITPTGSSWTVYCSVAYHFQCVNTGDAPVYYQGYTCSSPIYQKEIKTHSGWIEQPGGWCGTGLKIQVLEPGESFLFSVHPPDNELEWRFVIQHWEYKEHPIKTFSPAIQSGFLKPHFLLAKLDAAELVNLSVKWNPDHRHPYAFTAENISDTTLYYPGFLEPDIPPFHFGREWIGGKWKEDGTRNWSGSHLNFRALNPGDNISFSIPAQSLKNDWKIGLMFFTSDRPVSSTDAYEPVWWPRLPKRGDKPNLDVVESEN